jgi:hypothetical protein
METSEPRNAFFEVKPIEEDGQPNRIAFKCFEPSASGIREILTFVLTEEDFLIVAAGLAMALKDIQDGNH